MFKDTYKNYNKNIVPSDKLVADTLNKVSDQNAKNIICMRKYKKVLSVAAVIITLVGVMALLPAFAVQIDPLYNLMYHFSPGFAQFYTPVNESSTSNDVRMEVLACYVHEDTIEIYLTMQDLSGERFSGGVDLYDSYSINTPYDCSSNCRLVSYDDETKTAGFLITVSQWNDKDILGDKITFTVKEIITDDRVYSLNVPIDLGNISISKDTQKIYINSGSTSEYENYSEVLVPTEPYEEFTVEGVDLTGIGFIDGKLHIQYGVKDNSKCDNYGYFSLVDTTDSKSKLIYPVDEFYFLGSDGTTSYHEFVFDVSSDEIRKYKLYCEFFTTGEYIKGNWKVTFSIENRGEYNPSKEDERYISRDVDLSDIETMNIGAQMPELLYADENQVIINGTCGIVVYDLNEGYITNRLTCEDLRQRGVFDAVAFASMDGQDVYIFDLEEGMHSALSEISLYKYNLSFNSLSQRKGMVEDVYPKQQFGFTDEDKRYIDNSKLTGSLSVHRDNDFIFLQANTNWSMSSLQIVICDYDTGEKRIINIFE